MSSSHTQTTTFVWARTDLIIHCIQQAEKHGGSSSNNGTIKLASGWKPRTRSRSSPDDDWGWCRCVVTNAATKQESSRQLKPTRKPAVWNINNVSNENATKCVTITVIDTIWAPPMCENQQVTVELDVVLYNQLICPANAWWTQVLLKDKESQENDAIAPPDDLTHLEQLHEPAVVYCLWERYQRDVIYTYTGKILLALNPFKPLPLYGEEYMNLYSRPMSIELERPPPHIYATAEDAYRSLLESTNNQSILVSGESGAGKTVTTKIILRYLATLSQQQTDEKFQTTSIEAQVLQSNPILESFGNARTVRNDNSSRFGKFMQVTFNSRGTLVSAQIETYLLEKVRLVKQSPGERNYHIFYELLAGLPQRDRQSYSVSHSTAQDFVLTANSAQLQRRDNVDDRETYQELRHALDIVGFTAEEQHNLFTILCGLLYVSNIKFVRSDSDDSSRIDRSVSSLEAAVKLLGLGIDDLEAALTLVVIEAAGEKLHKHLSVEKASKAVEAFIKVTYGALFKYLVRRINKSIAGSTNASSAASSGISGQCIGVLDIFGFESFEENSLEQLCINYCNEALQQQFNRFVFTLEQEEYKREGIDWSFIAFPDNQDVLDLIEKKRDGILSILDEQCRLARCTDRSFALATYKVCLSHSRFEATKAQQASFSFGVHHYAGMVEYSTEGFLEKNKDELPKEMMELLASSTYPFLVHLGSLLSEVAPTSNATTTRRPAVVNKRQFQRNSSSLMHESVGTQFSSQLRQLRTRIEATEPHYVRCLKPNDELTPQNFDAVVIADQLRCAGVLEAIRVSRIGFPHRYSHEQFIRRYSLLARSLLQKQRRRSVEEQCQLMVSALSAKIVSTLEASDSQGSRRNDNHRLGIQLGRTKVFLRRQAFEALEHLYAQCLNDAAIKIQSFARMSNAMMHYEILLYAVRILQRFFRKVGAYRHYRAQREMLSTLTLQRSWRCYVARRFYHSALCIAWWGQSIYRGIVARQYCAYLFLDRKVSIIQRSWKRYISRKALMRVRGSVVSLQTHYRRRKACRVLYSLRAEAKDLSRVAAERDHLRQEALLLKKQLEEAKKVPPPPHPDQYTTPKKSARSEEVTKLKNEVERLQRELESAHKYASPSQASNNSVVEELQSEMAKKEYELQQLRTELLTLRSNMSSHNGSMTGLTFSISSPSDDIRPHRLESLSINGSSPIRADVSLFDQGLSRRARTGPDILETTDFRPVLMEDTDPVIEVTNDVEHLHSAIKVGSRGLFDQIIDSSLEPCALVNQGDNYGRTALHVAVMACDANAVTQLLLSGAAVNAQDIEGETPLHLSEDSKITLLLLERGNANPNIPNIDGICALHLAVQRRDVDSVRTLLQSNGDVNVADNLRWFTPLHLIALPNSQQAIASHKDIELHRLQIAILLLESEGSAEADLDYQDREGNSPLHYAVQLDSPEACRLIKLFVKKGANPNICNDRSQSPLHLLCHNDFLRSFADFQEVLKCLLYYGANPSIQSMTGCTPLHLSLYHRDISSSMQLIHHGAELHLQWKKPKRWASFWNDMGSTDVLALDMVEDRNSLYRLLVSINSSHMLAPTRSYCMHCRISLKQGRTRKRAVHCRHCSRLVCDSCTKSCLPAEYFPKSFNMTEAAWVCCTCEQVLVTRMEDAGNSSRTLPTSSYGDDDELYAC